MLIALALALVATLGGVVASYAYDDDAPLGARLAYGATTGFLALGFAGFIAAIVAGPLSGPLIGAFVAALPLLALANRDVRDRLTLDARGAGTRVVAAVRRPGWSTTGPLLFWVAIVALLWLAFDRVIVETDESLGTGFVNNLGDLPFHLGVISAFAYGHNFPPENPIFAGSGFSYPYISDVITAHFVLLGASMRDAFFVQNLVLGLALVGLLQRFAAVLTRDRLASYIAPLLVLFSGGLGWLLLFDQARAGERGLLAVIGRLPQDYTLIGEGPLRFGNTITTLLVTQRSLALGMPVALIVFIILWRFVHDDGSWGIPRVRGGGDVAGFVARHRLPLSAAILTGLLPLVHAHTFGVVLGSAFFIGLAFRGWRDGRWFPWLVYVVVTLLIAVPMAWWSASGSVAGTGSFFGIELGWDRRDANPIWFWLANTGLFIPLAIGTAIWLWRERGRRATDLLLFSAVFVVWFVVANVFKLAPWIWDNIKVLIYWFVGLTPLVALGLAAALRSTAPWRAGAVAALLVLTLAGGLDVWRVVSRQTEFGEFDGDALAAAAIIRNETPPRATILHAPTFNAPVYLTGRRSLMGYAGHLWSSGVDYFDREADIKRMYAGEPDALDLLHRYDVDVIVVSPMERAQLAVNDAFLDQFPILARSGVYTLYEVPKTQG